MGPGAGIRYILATFLMIGLAAFILVNMVYMAIHGPIIIEEPNLAWLVVDIILMVLIIVLGVFNLYYLGGDHEVPTIENNETGTYARGGTPSR